MRNYVRFVTRLSFTAAILFACSCDDVNGPPDTTAPGTILDLAVSRTTLESVTLSWSAPGDDDGAGRAARYLVRYWTAPANTFGWDTATPVAETAIPAPTAPGTRQECTIGGLTAFRLVYCVVRTLDDAGNLAPLSNRIATAAEPPVATSDAEVIGKLSLAYQLMDQDRFDALLHPDYQFRLNAPGDDGTEYWGAAEESHIHHRMLHPAGIPAIEPPVPVELWLVAIDLWMMQATPFEPAPQYYADPVRNPGGLDPVHWEAHAAVYNTTVFFETQGDTDYRVEGRAEFVIANDLTKVLGDPGKFLLFRWNDLGAFALQSQEQKTWSSIKSIYR